jgi:rubrerythrin
MEIKDSKTADNLKAAFAGESQANRRYLYFAQKADIEGAPDVAAVFRSTAEGETGHAHGHLEYLEEVGDPATGEPMGETEDNLKSAIQGETHEYTDMYPGMARTARDEGFDEALVKKLEGDIEVAKADLKVFLEKPIGVAEHIDYVITAEKKLEALATAEDKLESLLKL